MVNFNPSRKPVTNLAYHKLATKEDAEEAYEKFRWGQGVAVNAQGPFYNYFVNLKEKNDSPRRKAVSRVFVEGR